MPNGSESLHGGTFHRGSAAEVDGLGGGGRRWYRPPATGVEAPWTDVRNLRVSVKLRRRGADVSRALDRDAPEREPALQLGLDRQLGADLRLQPHLALAVALLRARRGHEGVEGAAL